MAKTTVTTYSCDICNREGAKRHSFFFDRGMDAAGSMENEYYDVDLCPMHFRELARKHGTPKEYSQSRVGRKQAMKYGYGVKAWIEMQKVVWRKMSNEERRLALQIEGL